MQKPDITKRLRELHQGLHLPLFEAQDRTWAQKIIAEAADEIERLRSPHDRDAVLEEAMYEALARTLDGYMIFGNAAYNRPSAVYRVTGDWQPIGDAVFEGGDEECMAFIRREAVKAIRALKHTERDSGGEKA